MSELLLLLLVAASVVLGGGAAVAWRVLDARGAAVRELARRWGSPVHEHLFEVSTSARLRDRRVDVRAGTRVWVQVRTPAHASPPPGADELRTPAAREAVEAGARWWRDGWGWSGPPGTSADELQRIAALLVEAAADVSAPRAPPPVEEEVPAGDPSARRARGLRRTSLLAGRRPAGLSDEELVGWLDDPDPLVVIAAARALGRGGVEHLWRLSEADERERRLAAVVALAELGVEPARVEVLLLELLGGGDDDVVRALGRVGGRTSVAPLRALAATPFTSRGRAVLDALARIRARSGSIPGVLAEAVSLGGELSEPSAPGGGGLSVSGEEEGGCATVEGNGPSSTRSPR